MTKIWPKLGRLTFWIIWPALFFYLYTSKRTRLLIVCGDEVLVAKGWLGVGRWELPGGGLHKGEDPLQGALRELHEETGLVVEPDQLKPLHQERSIAEYGLTFDYTAYLLELPEKPITMPAKYELVELKWIPWKKLLSMKDVSPNTIKVISNWANN